MAGTACFFVFCIFVGPGPLLHKIISFWWFEGGFQVPRRRTHAEACGNCVNKWFWIRRSLRIFWCWKFRVPDTRPTIFFLIQDPIHGILKIVDIVKKFQSPCKIKSFEPVNENGFVKKNNPEWNPQTPIWKSQKSFSVHFSHKIRCYVTKMFPKMSWISHEKSYPSRSMVDRDDRD